LAATRWPRPTGTYTVNLTDWGGSGFSTYYEAIVYSNVNQTTPVGATASYVSCQSTSSPGYTLNTKSADSVISGMLVVSGNPAIAPGGGQSAILTQTDGSHIVTQEVDDQLTASAGAYPMSYTLSSTQYYIYEAIEIEQAACVQSNVKVSPLVDTGVKGTTTPGITAEAKTATPTSSFTPTATMTVTVTPTDSGLLQGVVAGPNISRNGEPVKFMVNLGGSATIQLHLFSLTGEEVFSENIQGNAGLNTLLWLLRNKGQAPVASGLYVYTIQVNNGYEMLTKTGKVLVFH